MLDDIKPKPLLPSAVPCSPACSPVGCGYRGIETMIEETA